MNKPTEDDFAFSSTTAPKVDRKLRLERSTVRILNASDLAAVVGGAKVSNSAQEACNQTTGTLVGG
jgi:hypothetical protein